MVKMKHSIKNGSFRTCSISYQKLWQYKRAKACFEEIRPFKSKLKA